MRFLLALLLTLTALNAASIGWQHNYERALSKAKNEDKPLMVYLYLPSCKSCGYMNDKVFSDRQVVDYLGKNYVAVKLYPNDSGLPSELRSEMSPVFFFLNSQNAEVIESIMGGKKAEKFLRLLQESYEGYKTENKK
ncbi:thioredoxin family protein [bacterium]|jgi:thiol:disulfide interchange protein|nr:thioredoxin family protein [bacterium]